MNVSRIQDKMDQASNLHTAEIIHNPDKKMDFLTSYRIHLHTACVKVRGNVLGKPADPQIHLEATHLQYPWPEAHLVKIDYYNYLAE